MDSYSLFIERAMNLLGKKSLMAFIIPYTWLTIKQHISLRKYLLSHNIFQIIDLPTKVFEDADLDTTIVMIGNDKDTKNINIGRAINKSIQVDRQISVENIKRNEEFIINLNTSDRDYSILEKILGKSVKLDEVFEVSQGYIPYRRSDLIKEYGEKIGNRIVDERLWHSDEQESEDFKQEVQGRDVSRYGYKESFQYVKYGKWLAGYVAKKFFTSARILIMEVTRGDYYKIKSTYIEKELYNTPSIINVIHPQNDKDALKFILSCINSRLYTWYHTKIHAKANATTSIPKILVKDIRNLPVVELSKVEQQPFVTIADQIINLKNQNQDTHELEAQIDQMVYKLYGLTDGEIAIVEGKAVSSESEIGYNTSKEEQ